MKKNAKIGIGIAVIAVIAIVAAYLGFSNNEASTYTGDFGGTINVRTGETFKIVLEGHPTTGYGWTPEFDETHLKLVNREYKADNPELVGSPGKETFEFQAVKTGGTTIKFTYARPWESVPPLEVKGFMVEIK